MSNTLLVPIEGSGRHIHLTDQAVAVLFGSGYKLRKRRSLALPGGYVYEETLEISGPKGYFHRVALLGPLRQQIQVEISLTDAKALGINAPIRLSGDLDGSAPITLKGPAGILTLPQGAIAAKRHIHLSASDFDKYGLKDKEIVSVKVAGSRGLVFDEVIVRSDPMLSSGMCTMHLDYDEINAAALDKRSMGTVIIARDHQ